MINQIIGFSNFLREFRKLGYVDGKNVSFESRYFGNEFDRLPPLAEELVGLKIDVIVTRGTPETLALKKATKTIPIVFYSVTDPVGAGLVDSLERPGENITGFTSIEAVLAGKRLELLKETCPNSPASRCCGTRRIAAAQQWKESQSPAREVGLQLHSMEVSSSDKYESAFKVRVTKVIKEEAQWQNRDKKTCHFGRTSSTQVSRRPRHWQSSRLRRAHYPRRVYAEDF